LRGASKREVLRRYGDICDKRKYIPDDEERERVKASVYAALRVLSGVRKGGFVPILYQSEEDF